MKLGAFEHGLEEQCVDVHERRLQQMRGQLGYLSSHGFTVTVAARGAEPDQPPQPGKWDDDVTVEHLPFVREPSPVADLRALWATIGLIRRTRPTIVNASTPKASLLGSVTAWLCLVPVRVYVVRGFQFEDGDPVDAETRAAIEQHDRIVVVPWLEHTGAAYRALGVLAFPSAREGLPNVPLEG